MSSLVETAAHGPVLRVWLNRPEKRNALNAELCRALADTLETADRDDAVHAILLAGRGKSFSAGMDLEEAAAGDSEEVNQLHDRLFTIGSRMGTPVVGAIHGASFGGGAGVVANCHIVVAAEDAEFGLTEIRLGLWPFLIYRAVAEALGDRRTLELALTGRIFKAPEAREMGLVHFVAADYENRALALAEGLAASSPAAIRGGMSYRREARGRDWNTAGEIARKSRNQVFQSPEFQEALRRFLKRS